MVESQPTTSPAPPQLTYLDRLEISETFADSMWRINVEGGVAKLEFVVNRLDDPQPSTPLTGKVITAARIVVPLPSLLEMMAKLQGIIGQLQAAGVLRPIPLPPTGGRPN
jgi:hypothetical protein